MNTWRQRLGWNVPPAEFSISEDERFLKKLLDERFFHPAWTEITEIAGTDAPSFGWEMRFRRGADIVKVFSRYLSATGVVVVYTDSPNFETAAEFETLEEMLVYIQRIADEAKRLTLQSMMMPPPTASKKVAWDKEAVPTISPKPEWQKYFDALDRLWTNGSDSAGGIDGQYPELRDNPVLFRQIYDTWDIARFGPRKQKKASAPIEGKKLLKSPFEVTQGTRAWEIARIGVKRQRGLMKRKEEFVLVGLECSQEVGVRIAKISSKGCEVLESFKLPKEKYSWRELINEAQWTARLNDIAKPIQKEAVVQCQNCGDTRSTKAIGTDTAGKTITLCHRCNNANVRQRLRVQASEDGLGYCKTCKVEVMSGVKYSHQGHEVI